MAAAGGLPTKAERLGHTAFAIGHIAG